MASLKHLMPLFNCVIAAGSLFNIVGFQTHLKWGEQKRVFRMIPGLENAEFVRYGVMHRNSYIDSPNLLTETFATRQNPNLFFAGQMTGVEGYVESAASGLSMLCVVSRVKNLLFSLKQQLSVLYHTTSLMLKANISNQ